MTVPMNLFERQVATIWEPIALAKIQIDRDYTIWCSHRLLASNFFHRTETLPGNSSNTCEKVEHQRLHPLPSADDEADGVQRGL